MSAKNLSIDQNWCRVLADSLIWKIQCRFGYFDTQKTAFDMKTVFLTCFSETAMQRARGTYFVNRYGTFWKEENFNFPEHQKILKFIKKSLRKSKKHENFSKIFMFFPKIWKISIFSKKSKKIEKSRKITILENFQIFEKKMKKFETFHIFLIFSMIF